MKFSIKGKIYDVRVLDDLSLRHLLELQTQTKELGRELSAGEIQEMGEKLDQLPKDERKLHPDAPWVLAFTIWGSRRLAGENVTFEQAIDFPMRELTFLPEPEDRKAAAGPQKRPARNGGGAAAARGSRATSGARTSKRASTGG